MPGGECGYANPVDPEERDSHDRKRLDRELGQLLNETRVAMPGVQVLFAFLLTVPFAAGYGRMSSFDRAAYLVALLASAVASACFIAPSAYHRLLFRMGQKAHLVGFATRITLVGLGFLALAMNASILLVVDVVADRTAAWLVTACTAVLFVLLWFGVALRRRFD
jgi:hypothetical protein